MYYLLNQFRKQDQMRCRSVFTFYHKFNNSKPLEAVIPLCSVCLHIKLNFDLLPHTGDQTIGFEVKKQTQP